MYRRQLGCHAVAITARISVASGTKVRAAVGLFETGTFPADILVVLTEEVCQIGEKVVSALGGAFSSDVAMYAKLRKAAADLGADAVLVTGQSQGFMTTPGVQTTLGNAYTTASVTGNPYYATVAGHTTSKATTVGMPAMTFSYPKSQGIAIKYASFPSAS